MSLSAQDKIRVAVSIVGVAEVWCRLEKFIDMHGVRNPGEFIVEKDGSIYYENTGRYLTETELEEFVEWREKENA